MHQHSPILVAEDSFGTLLQILTLFSKSTVFSVHHLNQEAQNGTGQ